MPPIWPHCASGASFDMVSAAPSEATSGELLDRLTGLAAETAFSDLPPAAVGATQTFLLDSLAVGVAGRTGPWREDILSMALAWGHGGTARILGDGLCVPPATAAFVNAWQMHCLEFDCVHEGAVAHVMSAVVPAALAECDRRAVDGQKLLLALTIGVEVAAILGLAANAPLRFFRPATVGAFGAAIAVGVLRGFDAPAIGRCFGHALGQVAGTMQAHEEGKPTLPLQLGAAARAGLVAADLAQAGVPAPANALEGRYGYLPLFEACSDAKGVASQIGQPWRVTELSHKPYPSGRATHGGIEAALRLRGQGVRPSHLRSMRLRAPPLIHQLVIRPAHQGMHANYARLCFPYVGAVALECGTVGLDHFSEQALNQPAPLALAKRFTATVDEAADQAAFVPQTLAAALHDGRCLEVRIDNLLGSPAHPLTPRQQEAKVGTCLAAVFADAFRAQHLMAAVHGLPEAADARTLLDSITDPAPTGR